MRYTWNTIYIVRRLRVEGVYCQTNYLGWLALVPGADEWDTICVFRVKEMKSDAAGEICRKYNLSAHIVEINRFL